MNDYDTELKRLKKTVLEMEQDNRDEKECLLGVINTFGTVVAMQEEMIEEFRAIRKMVNTDQPLPLDSIEKEIGRLKDKIIAMEKREVSSGGDVEGVNDLEDRLLEACRIVKKIMAALLEDFYPLTRGLEVKAGAIDITCTEKTAQIELRMATSDFLSFIEGLKAKISEDFRYINRSFLTLLDHVKELEKTFTREFGGEDRLKEIEYFEMKVSDEVGSIVNSFNIYRTISEIKSTVIEKIENIKRLVSIRKKDEKKRSRRAKKDIDNLKKRIVEAETAALEMSEKAEQLETVAMNDGLTGLYNRNAFDMRVMDALKAFSERGEAFSVVLFDVDDFKNINDTFGHVAGDKVLQKVAQCLRETFREDDFMARYGGDEFAVVIEKLTEEMARQRITNFKKNLRKRRFISYAKGDINISASAGYTLAMEGDTPDTLIDRADKIMYASKQKKS